MISWSKKTLIIISISSYSAVFATNGYNSHGVGTKNKGMAGAGLAMPEQSISMANNPASLTQIDNNFDFSLSIFSPIRSYNTSISQANGQFGAFTIDPTSQNSGREYFIIPTVSKNWKIDDKNAWGIAFYGKGGMNTTWNGGSATFDPDGPGPAPVSSFPGVFGGGNPTGVDLSQALFDIGYARQVTEKTSIGISAVLAFQMFEANGLGAFAGFTNTFNASGGTVFPENLTNNGHDSSFGGGLKLGFHTDINESTSIAASYSTKLNMSNFDEYADLFANDGSFDIPASIKAGITFKSQNNFHTSLDIEHTYYSDVDSIGNPVSNLFSCPAIAGPGGNLDNCLGGSNGGGFGWDDVTSYKLGFQWDGHNNIVYRAGYSYTSQPIDENDVVFNILAPGIIEHHLTFGFTKQLKDGENEWTMALLYAPESEVKGLNAFDPSQSIEIAMYQWELEFSYGW